MPKSQSPVAANALFATPGTKHELEHGQAFTPKFDEHGLIAAIAVDAETGDMLMLAWMNAEAVAATMETGIAHFWSRSRQKLWRKGETSGNELHLVELLTDCDQDALLLRVTIQGDGVACHTGARSCFYRAVPLGQKPSPKLQLVPAASTLKD